MPDQADFFRARRRSRKTARGFTWGPNVNVTYQSYKDAFGKAIRSRGARSPTALDDDAEATVADMKKTGFTVSG